MWETTYSRWNHEHRRSDDGRSPTGASWVSAVSRRISAQLLFNSGGTALGVGVDSEGIGDGCGGQVGQAHNCAWEDGPPARRSALRHSTSYLSLAAASLILNGRARLCDRSGGTGDGRRVATTMSGQSGTLARLNDHIRADCRRQPDRLRTTLIGHPCELETVSREQATEDEVTSAKADAAL